MAEQGDQEYLSIGEVLGLLLEEFPDVTISKIRFLESQGLIDPERTPSGYRKFYDGDVELLRVILREQRENYLPLRVIKDRIETGVIDPSGEVAKPATISPSLTSDQQDETAELSSEPATSSLVDEVAATSVAHHPAAHRDVVPPSPSAVTPAHSIHPGDHRAQFETTNGVRARVDGGATADQGSAGRTPIGTTSTPSLLPGVLLDRSEFCELVGLRPEQLDELERFGVVHGRGSGAGTMYGDDAVEIAAVAIGLLRSGLDARHLRAFRTAAEREVSLYEQLVTPRLRQRNPAARADALESLRQLEELGGRLRAALTRTALRHHFDA